MTTAAKRVLLDLRHRSARSDVTSVVIGLVVVLCLQVLGAVPAAASVPASSTTITVSGQRAIVRLPARADAQTPVPVVIHYQGLDQDADLHSVWQPLANAALDAGFAVVTCDFHGNSYGSPAAMADSTALWAAVRAMVPAGHLYLSGDSHGGIGALNAVTTGALSDVHGVYLVEPVVSLRQRYDNGRKPQITAAYALAADGSDYATRTAGYDPALRPADDFHGVPLDVTASPADTLVPKADHADALLAKLAATDYERTHQASGGHGDASEFNAEDYRQFLLDGEAGRLVKSPAGVIHRRLQGSDRYATAVALSHDAFDTAGTVVIADGAAFPDALAAAPAAASLHAPTLLTSPTTLPPAVVEEITRLGAHRAVVVGGPGAVSDGVAQALGALVSEVDRVQGGDRYGTAAALATDVLYPSSTPAHVLITSGEAFPDGLAAGAYGASVGAPLLLTGRDVLPSATAQALTRLHPARITIIGGPASVSAALATQLASFAPKVERVAGQDRYATAAAVSEQLFTRAPSVQLASGLDFPDALAGAALGQPLQLSRRDCMPAVTAASLTRLGTGSVLALGGTAVLNDSAVTGTRVCT